MSDFTNSLSSHFLGGGQLGVIVDRLTSTSMVVKGCEGKGATG